MQPVRICDRCRGDVVPPDEKGHVPVRLIRESSDMPIAPIPSDVGRHVVELLLLQRVDVTGAPQGFLLTKCILSFVAKSKENISFPLVQGPIHCLVVPVPFASSLLLESKSSWRVQCCLTDCITVKSLISSDKKLELLILRRDERSVAWQITQSGPFCELRGFFQTQLVENIFMTSCFQ